MLVETSVQDEHGNVINFSDTSRDSVGVRPRAPLSLFDLNRPAVWVDGGPSR